MSGEREPVSKRNTDVLIPPMARATRRGYRVTAQGGPGWYDIHPIALFDKYMYFVRQHLLSTRF